MKVRPTSGGNRFTMMALRPAICSVVALCAFPAWAQLASPTINPYFRGPAVNSAAKNIARPDYSSGSTDAGASLAASVAATTAWEDAEAAERERPGSVPALKLAALQQQALAQKVRWAVAERDQRVGVERFNALDRVLAEFDSATDRLNAALALAELGDEKAWHDLYVALKSDHMLALLERERPAQTIAMYDALRASGAELKPYALVVVAEALSQERRSAETIPLYEAALINDGNSSPMPVETQFGLIYAYLDNGRFEDAEALLVKIESETPALLRLTPQAGRPNPEYTSVNGMRGFLLLYTNRLEQAQQHFDALLQEAPFNAGYGEGAAEVERLRGHPRAALAQYEALAANHPYDRNIRADRAQTLLDLNEFAAARRIGDSLAADYPDSIFVRKFEREQRAVTGAFLEVETSAGSGSGSAIVDRSWNIDSRLSSGVMRDEWRVFYDQIVAGGETGAEKENWARGGLGLSWQRGGWLAEGKVQQANMGPYRSSVAGRLSYRIDDNWEVSGAVNGNSKDAPWKARISDIGARDAGATVSYLFNESRRFDVSWQRLKFSDTNRRDAVFVSWRERWISGPRLKLESLLSADTSSSRLQATPYFSPSHDASVQAGLNGEWLTWKADNRQFFQIFGVSTGGYRQADFGTKPLWNLRYEHQWNLGQKLQLRYGLSLSSHPYDGVREQQRSVFVNFLLPLS
jgi:biofilm PGA synthesis protein PgaA